MIPRFTWSDAWLLFAVALAATSGKVTLKDVIACGDGIQHAIFTPDVSVGAPYPAGFRRHLRTV